MILTEFDTKNKVPRKEPIFANGRDEVGDQGIFVQRLHHMRRLQHPVPRGLAIEVAQQGGHRLHRARQSGGHPVKGTGGMLVGQTTSSLPFQLVQAFTSTPIKSIDLVPTLGRVDQFPAVIKGLVNGGFNISFEAPARAGHDCFFAVGRRRCC